MLNIAITGGVASGKSTVADYLIKQGFTVIDADKMSREITGAGGKAMPYILEHFGPEFVNEDGSMNRAAMRDLVFRDPDKKKLLEAGTTDVVLEDIAAIRNESASRGDEVLFFDIPLLFETHQEGNYDAVWVVTADRDIRIQRITERDGLDETIADLMINSQEEEDVKIEKGDFVIYNNGTVAELRRSVDDALLHYTAASKNQ